MDSSCCESLSFAALFNIQPYEYQIWPIKVKYVPVLSDICSTCPHLIKNMLHQIQSKNAFTKRKNSAFSNDQQIW